MAGMQGQGGGRPLKFKTVGVLKARINKYFAECDPHWIQQEYWDHPFIEAEPESEELEAQPQGGALKRRHAEKMRERDYSKPMEKQYRSHLTRQVPYTITGLAMALETTRDVLIDYESGMHDSPESTADDNKKFSYAIKSAKLKCQNFAEIYLFDGKNTAGAIFNLKNNYEWRDRTEVDEKSEQTITVVTRGAGKDANND